MRNARTLYSLLGLLATLGVLAWACSLDSPTAPRQNPPPPGGGTNPTAYRITISAEFDEIVVEVPSIDGQQCGTTPSLTTLTIDVREVSSNRRPPNGTTILLETSLGSFEGSPIPVTEIGTELISGEAFVNFYACSTTGVAHIRAFLGTSVGRTTVQIIPPTTPVVADFTFENSDSDLSVQFLDTSTGGPTSFFWSFGDGDTSSAQHPLHEFPEPGDYVVALTASNSESSDTETQIITVGIEEPPPV
jgi:PKD repeat protein